MNQNLDLSMTNSHIGDPYQEYSLFDVVFFSFSNTTIDLLYVLVVINYLSYLNVVGSLASLSLVFLFDSSDFSSLDCIEAFFISSL